MIYFLNASEINIHNGLCIEEVVPLPSEFVSVSVNKRLADST
jgi:hypothetical protein